MSNKLRIPAKTLQQQFSSSDPAVSAWVSANAGSGKTHVLTQRVIRLLLDGTAPDRILCLTFTKAAAANMKNRVFEVLSKWTMMDDEALKEAIENLTGISPSKGVRLRARCLFTRALDAPGGLKIQTIHAFCEALLHQFPLEANVPGHFETLQEVAQADLLGQSKAYVLGGEGSHGSSLKQYVAAEQATSQFAVEAAIEELIAKRTAFSDWIADGVELAVVGLYERLGLQAEATAKSIIEEGLARLPTSNETLVAIAEIATLSDKVNDQEQSKLIRTYLTAIDPNDRLNALVAMTLTKKGEPRAASRIVTKFVKDRIADSAEQLIACAQTVIVIRDQLLRLRTIELSRDLFKVAERVLERYEALKRARGVIDFDDQIEKCASLLTRSNIRDWIRYRLDRGIDHLLVDEAQDTSPRQWAIINALTEDFNSGESAAMRDRTVFVVGDEKQSIFSFQGARPQEFAKQEARLRKDVAAAGKPFHSGRLNLSFRSTPDVLHAVDRVFSIDENRKGLTQSGEANPHDAIRSSDPGEVHVWPLYLKTPNPKTEDWMAPVDQRAADDPAVLLASRITETIGNWVGKPLSGGDEPLKFGDILVLVRKRDHFITALTRKMKDAGLQVAGADRIVLTEHIAVEDLLAVARFTLMPRDDLNLACVLKGVLFNLDEETLFKVCHEREAGILDQVRKIAVQPDHELNHTARKIVDVLDRIAASAGKLDAFEFFGWLLGPFGLRKALLSRLGMEAEDVLDAFLDEALSFVREGGIGLENFVSSIARSRPEIKREVELERDEVRVLTVHAAKGLEARLVFLVDPGNAPWNANHRPKIMQLGDGECRDFIWVPNKDFESSTIQSEIEKIRSSAEAEYRRLLYVGMTRAADRLVVCGYRGIRPPSYRHWHLMVHDALLEDATEIPDHAGEVSSFVWRSGKGTPVSKTQDRPARCDTRRSKPDLPVWATTPAPKEPSVPKPLSPAGAHALIDAEMESTGAVTAGFSPREMRAMRRGILIHKLLEALPDIADENREEAIAGYLEKAADEFIRQEKEEIRNSVLSVLKNDSFVEMLTLPSTAEVSVTGKLQTRSGHQMIAGQIDRLFVGDQKAIVLDYKTGQFVPRNASQTPTSHITQLALYREMISQIYPDHEVECVLLWTSEPRWMQMPDHLLDEAIVKIRNMQWS